MSRGHRALKLKVGFDLAADCANLASLRQLVGNGMLAADANQALVDRRARWRSYLISPNSVSPGWRSRSVPIGPGRNGRRLRKSIDVPLAAGENIASRDGFSQALGGRRAAGRSTRYRQMGRPERLFGRRARHHQIGQDVLSALSRRWHWSAGIGAFAGRGGGRRIAGSRFQRQSAARPVLWSASLMSATARSHWATIRASGSSRILSSIEQYRTA